MLAKKEGQKKGSKQRYGSNHGAGGLIKELRIEQG